jgi:hypothetical protein
MLATPGYLTDWLSAQMRSGPRAVTFISREVGSGAFWASLGGDNGLGEPRRCCEGPGEALRAEGASREGPAPDEEGPRLR